MVDDDPDPDADPPDGGADAGSAVPTISRRDRNGEVWLTGPEPLDGTLDGPGRRTLAAAIAEEVATAGRDGATAVHWESDGPEDQVDEVAGVAGLPDRRDILMLGRGLPLPEETRPPGPPLAVRALRPGTADEEAWVRCNNRSFAGHPDQGSETVASLRAALARPGTSPADLLVLDGEPPVDDGGDLDGFCWVKTHPATASTPARGEIFVIGTDPGAAGRGLGTRLVVAGLDHMVATGLTEAILYVDADNGPARRLYDRLGFATLRTRRVRSVRPDRP